MTTHPLNNGTNTYPISATSLSRCQPSGAPQAVHPSQISQSSLGIGQDSIELNWILFDKSHRTPVVISIPRDLYKRPSQHCRPLFVQPLREEYDVVTAPERIAFWTVGGKSFSRCVASEPSRQAKEPLSIEVAAEKEWATSIDHLEDHFKLVLRPSPFSRTLTVDDDKLVHLVITVRDEGSVVGQSKVDLVPELKEFKRMFNPSCLSIVDTSC